MVLLLFLLSAVLGGCATYGAKKIGEEKTIFSGYEPVAPMIAPWYTKTNTDGVTSRLGMPTEQQGIRALLTDFMVSTTVRQLSGDAKVTYLKAGGNLNAGRYEVVVDVFAFAPVDVGGNSKNCLNNTSEKCAYALEELLVGSGVRFVVEVNSAKAGFSLSELKHLNAQANVDGLNASLDAVSYGVQPVPMDFSTLSMPKADKSMLKAILEAAEEVKGKLMDSKTVLTPHVFAIKRLNPPSGPQSEEDETNKRKSLLTLIHSDGTAK